MAGEHRRETIEDWARETRLGGRRPARHRNTELGAPRREAPLPIADPDKDWIGGADDRLHRVMGRAYAWYETHAPESPVLSRGDESARIMLMGKAPSVVEVRMRRPFAARSGTLLARALAPLGLDMGPHGGVWATNASIWQTQAKVEPTREEIAATEPWTRTIIRILRPAVCVALGRTAAQTLTGLDRSIERMRGTRHALSKRWRESLGANESPIVIVTWHPAHLANTDRAWGPSKLVAFGADLRMAAEDAGIAVPAAPGNAR